MKPKAGNRKIELKFMDCSVRLEGTRNIESRALGLLAAMVQDRMKIMELSSEMDEDEGSSRKSKKKKLAADSEFMKVYV